MELSAGRGRMAGTRIADTWWPDGRREDGRRGADRVVEGFGRSSLGARSDVQRVVPGAAVTTTDWLTLCWRPRGPGHGVLRAAASMHIAAGASLLGAAALVWTFGVDGGALLWPLPLAGVGALVAMAGLVGLELTRGAGPVRLAARLMLPVLDLALVGAVIATLGGVAGSADAAVPLILAIALVLIAALAALLGDWRAGAAVVVLGAAASALTWSMVGGTGWWMGAGVVATAGGPIVLALGISQTRMARLGATLLAERATCDRDVAERIAAERRLRDGLRQVEDARLRLERERTTLDQRVGQMARYVRLLAEGDAEATRGLPAALAGGGPPSGPLAELAAGLDRIRLRVATRQAAGTDSGQMVALISRAAAEQARLLALTDADLRDQGAAANQLVRHLQVIVRSGGLANMESDRRAVREAEQLALAHASGTAMLGARMAQLRARQGDLDGQLRRLVDTESRPRAADLRGPASALTREGATPPGTPRTLVSRLSTRRGKP